jgi:hypothetical protein
MNVSFMAHPSTPGVTGLGGEDEANLKSNFILRGPGLPTADQEAAGSPFP